MRELSVQETEEVAGAVSNVNKQVSVVSVVNKSVSVKQIVVQKNGVTLVNKTRIKVYP